jgi:bifunctional DNA primase/polymerase-like protein/primase-like protein
MTRVLEPSPMVKTALALAGRGFPVFPCVPRSKQPATSHGCLDATIDADMIRRWWCEQPAFNVAVATGPASKTFVVDVDGLDAECELRRLEADHGELPPSVEVITARGRHIWFQYPPDRPVKNTAGKIAPGIDTRGDGGYVLTPPSVHPSGRPYAWSVDSAKTIAAAPAWLVEKIAAPTNGSGTPLPTPPSAWRELVECGVAEGARDDSTARLAGYLLRRSVDAFVTLELLQIWNASKCAPPLPASDIERIVASIAGKELKRRGAGNGQ